MGDRAFASARAAGKKNQRKSATEAGYARAKAEANTAPQSPSRIRGEKRKKGGAARKITKMTRERNISCTQPSRQPQKADAGGELRSSPLDARPTANKLAVPPDLSGRRAEVEGGKSGQRVPSFDMRRDDDDRHLPGQ